MQNYQRKNIIITASILTFIIVVYVTAVVTARICSGVSNESIVYITDESQAEIIQRFSRLEEVYEKVKDEYYLETSDDVLLQGAIDGMLASLNDQYTFYYTPEEMQTSNAEHNGLYEGIGIQLTIDAEEKLKISRVFKDSYAYEAGLRKGDIILSADGNELKAKNSAELSSAIEFIKGENGTTVQLTIQRNDEVFTTEVMRGNVAINRVEYEMLDGGIGYIELYEFFGDAVSGINDALEYMTENNAKGIIFDLRGNTGGQLDICLDICDLFLPDGVIVYTQDRSGEQTNYYSDAACCELPLVVLVNGTTASASEIFVGAIQDYGIGTVVGTKTFGKGIVQTWYSFSDDGAGMQLTTSEYFTPNGRSLNKTGITPDETVELSDEYDPYIFETDIENDNQLKRAYEILLEKIAEKEKHYTDHERP